MKRKWILLVMTMALVASLSACGNSGSEVTGSSIADVSEGGEKIVLGINDWPGSYWWLTVDELGYFEEHFLM